MDRPPPETVSMLTAVLHGEMRPVIDWLTESDRSESALGHGRLAARAAARQGHARLSTMLTTALDSWAPPVAIHESDGSYGDGSDSEPSLDGSDDEEDC